MARVDEAPADEAPADEAPADEAPADEAPADETPADETPADVAPASEAPADVAPASEVGGETTHANGARGGEADGSGARGAGAPADGTGGDGARGSGTRGDGTRGDGTRVVHAGVPAAVAGEPFLPSPVFGAPYHLDPVAGPQAGVNGYGRTDNPTYRSLEQAIGELEGGECVVFASGMAAISAVLLSTLRAGDTVVLPSDGYFLTRAFATEHLPARGVEVRTMPTPGPYPALDDVRLLLLETPSNPGLDVCDIADLAARTRAGGGLVAVDNTTPTPLGQRPLDLGADFSVASATKALTGHSDMLLGYVCARDPELIAAIRTWRGRTGGIPGAFEAWLAHRSLGTLDLRLARQTANAAAAAELLAGHPAVASVRWPGRAGDPAYAAAARQMRRIPGVVTFVLADKAAVDRFLTTSDLVFAATSFGGLHSSADRRAQWGDDAPEGLVRLSCGVEDTEDLIADVRRALDAAIA
ncbi:cystathionine gamma-lyase [Dactylosporangium vinaceum]|nr:cystathionine gamma-lyase [Dactylosporangium vinaceum]